MSSAQVNAEAVAAETAAPSGNVALQPVAISADGSTLLQHTVDGSSSRTNTVNPSSSAPFDPSIDGSLTSFFDIVETTTFIVNQGARRVGLQFPDELLPHAAAVEKELRAALSKLEDETKHEKERTVTAQQPQQQPQTAPAANASTSSASSPRELYILGDTSYGSCCVDEVAALHADCDLIVHYGFSCLSSTRRLPVRYVFGRKAINCEKVAAAVIDDTQWTPSDEPFSSSSSPPPSTSTEPIRLLLLYSVEYSHAIDDGSLPKAIQKVLEERSTATTSATATATAARGSREYIVTIGRVETERSKPSNQPPQSTQHNGRCACAQTTPTAATTCSAGSSCCSSSSTPSTSSCNCTTTPLPPTSAPSSDSSLSPSPAAALPPPRPLLFASPGVGLTSSTPLSHFRVSGYSFALPTEWSVDSETFRKMHVVWIGSDTNSSLLTNLMLNYNAHAFHAIHPLTSRIRHEVSNVNRTLARRYFLMEKIKNADIIGILIGTLGVADYLSALSHLRRLIRSSGKHCYTVSVGKPNDAKLANFSEIDVFVMLACPLATMFDSRGLIKEVVTPFECLMALEGKEWTGEYRTEFGGLIPAEESKNQSEKEVAGADDADSASTATASSPSTSQVSVAPASVSTTSIDSLSDDLAHGMRFDPITGKMREALPSQLAARGLHGSSAGGDQHGNEKDIGALVLVGDQQLVRVAGGALVPVKTASDHFQTARTFKGLEVRGAGEEEGATAKIEQGLSGIARQYTRTKEKENESEDANDAASPSSESSHTVETQQSKS